MTETKRLALLLLKRAEERDEAVLLLEECCNAIQVACCSEDGLDAAEGARLLEKIVEFMVKLARAKVRVE